MPTALAHHVHAEPAAVARATPPEECGQDWCPTCGKVHEKRPGDPRWHNPVHASEVTGLRSAMQYLFRLQLQRVLAHYHLGMHPPSKARGRTKGLLDELLGVGELDLRKFSRADAKHLKPALEVHVDAGGKQAMARIGYSARTPWNVHSPGVQDALQRHAVRLCNDTAATTNLAVRDAIAAVKRDVAAGLTGEEYTRRSLTDAIAKVFVNAERYRAQRIAVTEASMAIHDGEILAGKASGVVAGYEPLVSDDACELCQEMAEAFDFVPMDEAEAGLGEYAGLEEGRSLPPYHPNCQCTQTERIKEELLPGGPSGEEEEE